MIKRFTTFLMLLVAAASLMSVVPAGRVVAQNRHILIEEYTGYWCGFCVRGALGIELLKKRFPGQVLAVSLHGGGQGEPMENPQSDSLIFGTGLTFSTGFSGYPSMSASREPIGGKWVNDDRGFIDTIPGISTCGETAGLPAQAWTDTMVGKPAIANVKVDNMSLDISGRKVSCKVTATFNAAVSGDLRFGLYLVEDSVNWPDGSVFDQHNYYSSAYTTIGGTLPDNPFYNDGPTIPGWQHMQVFRVAPGGVWGVKGVIPASVTAGGSYSQSYTFAIPSNVQNPNHLRIIGFVHQFSKTNQNQNMIFDVADARFAPVPVFNPDITVTNLQQYLSAKSNGNTVTKVTYSNNETAPVKLNLAIDPNVVLPTGWSAKVEPATLTVPPTGTADATFTFTAPEQSAFVGSSIVAIPTQDGFYSNLINDTLFGLSDNTEIGLYFEGGAELAVYSGIPSSLQVHTAIIPNMSAVIDGLPITSDSKLKVAIFDNPDFIDGDGFYTTPGITLPGIETLLDAGKGVFLTGNFPFILQNDPNFNGYTHIHTDAADAFFGDRLGLSFSSTENKAAGVTYNITATSDPIGKGLPTPMSAKSTVATYLPIFTVDPTKSVPLFFFDKTAAKPAGVRYTNSTGGGKLVFLGFNLSNLTAANADTIAQHSIDWLLNSASGGVEQPGVAFSGSISASSNPFHGTTEINYTAVAGERDVTFAAYDLLGREVAKLTPRSTGDNAYSMTFDASTLADGTYTIIAHSSTGSKEIKVVNQH